VLCSASQEQLKGSSRVRLPQSLPNGNSSTLNEAHDSIRPADCSFFEPLPGCFGLCADGYTPNVNNVGLPATGVFSGGSIDSVQLQNGNLHVDIPLLHLPGIGMDTDIHFVKIGSDAMKTAANTIKDSIESAWSGDNIKIGKTSYTVTTSVSVTVVSSKTAAERSAKRDWTHAGSTSGREGCKNIQHRQSATRRRTLADWSAHESKCGRL
jgi:hypothetical protein